MFPRLTLPTWLLASLILCLQASHAQNAGKVSLRCVSFPTSMEPVKLKLWLGEDKTLDIEAPTDWLSTPIQVPPLGAWAVGVMADGPDGKTVFKELGRTKAPASPEQILLLVRKGKDNTDGFELIAIDGHVNGFGAGKYLFMNASKVDIAGVVGEEKFAIKPNRHAILKPKIPQGQHTVHTALYFRKDDEAMPFFSSEWRVSDDGRSLIFFYHDPRTMHIRFHAIRDYIN